MSDLSEGGASPTVASPRLNSSNSRGLVQVVATKHHLDSEEEWLIESDNVPHIDLEVVTRGASTVKRQASSSRHGKSSPPLVVAEVRAAFFVLLFLLMVL